MKIELHIGELVLDGVDLTPAQAERVRRELQRELARHLAAGSFSGELAAGTAVPAMAAGDIGPLRGATPRVIGQRIAQAVYGSIGATGPAGGQQERGHAIDGGAHE
jgi:hypothetical protein